MIIFFYLFWIFYKQYLSIKCSDNEKSENFLVYDTSQLTSQVEKFQKLLCSSIFNNLINKKKLFCTKTIFKTRKVFFYRIAKHS